MHRSRSLRLCCLTVSILLSLSDLSAGSEPQTLRVESEYQPDSQQVTILLPDQFDLATEKSKRKIRILYILPVEAATQSRWGDPVKETIKADIANRHQVICVFPEFAQTPWYADHPTDKHIRQESFFVKSVIPFVDQELSLDKSQVERYLVGFSKSGWGAFSLLLRHPQMFSKAAAWDAPLMMKKSGFYGSGPIFGDDANFQGYQISRLLERRARPLGKSPRLISLGYDNFRGHHLQFHKLATELKIPHIHLDGPQRKHHWESGWLSGATELLLQEEP